MPPHTTIWCCLERPGEAGPSAGLLPPGPGADARRRQRTLQPGQRLAGARQAGRKRPPAIAVRWSSSRIMPRPTATWAAFWRRSAIFRAPKTPSAPRCGTIPGWPSRITNWQSSWAASFRRRTWRRSAGCWRKPGWRTAQRLLLHFGLAQALDARGEYAEAAEHLEWRANALQLSHWRRCGQEYDPDGHELLITGIIGVLTPDYFVAGLRIRPPERATRVRRGAAAVRHNARRAILASHSQVFGAGEIKLVRDTRAARRTRCRLHRGPAPVEPPDGGPSCVAALGKSSAHRVPQHPASWTRCPTITSI